MTKHPLQPQLWPTTVRYITKNIDSLDDPIFTSDHFPMLRNSIELRKVPKTHPAYSTREDFGFGVFATEEIIWGDDIGEYTGLTRKLPNSLYGMRCSDTVSYIDAKLAGNEVFLK